MTETDTGLFVKGNCLLCIFLNYFTELNFCVNREADMWVTSFQVMFVTDYLSSQKVFETAKKLMQYVLKIRK